MRLWLLSFLLLMTSCGTPTAPTLPDAGFDTPAGVVLLELQAWQAGEIELALDCHAFPERAALGISHDLPGEQRDRLIRSAAASLRRTQESTYLIEDAPEPVQIDQLIVQPTTATEATVSLTMVLADERRQTERWRTIHMIDRWWLLERLSP